MTPAQQLCISGRRHLADFHLVDTKEREPQPPTCSVMAVPKGASQLVDASWERADDTTVRHSEERMCLTKCTWLIRRSFAGRPISQGCPPGPVVAYIS